MFGLPIGPTEAIIILIVALLIFGRRLPEVGRSIGKSIVEFKKGLAGIEDEVRSADNSNKGQQSPPASTPKHLENQSSASMEAPKQNSNEQNSTQHH